MERKVSQDLKDKLLYMLKNEFEIYILMIVFGIWYFLNINRAMEGDETIFALQGYYFIKGNMPAEQFRPMSRYFYGVGQLIFGRTTLGAKFFIFLLGVLTLYLTYKVCRIMSNRVYALLAAFIVGIIPLYGDLSVSGLMDIILAFFVMLLFYVTLITMRTNDKIKKQRLIFLLGVLSICTLATKLYGIFFSLVVFFFLVYTEWKTVKTIKLFKRKNITRKLKKNLVFMPIFVILGVLLGLLIRAQLSDLWNEAGEMGRADILDVAPGFLDNIILNMSSSAAYVFFIAIGVIILFILWVIWALVGRESLRILKCLAKKRKLDCKYHILIYLLGAVIGFILIYSPYIWNPVTLFTQILLNQTIHLKQGSPREVGGVVYESAPWWSYLYWTYIYLGIMFVVGLIISLCYTGFRFLKKEKLENQEKLLFVYTFIPFILLSLLSLKLHSYFVILFPLFSVYIVIQIKSILEGLAASSSQKILKRNINKIPIFGILFLMLLPGPLWMTLSDPQLGHDSGYDVAGELVIDYVEEHPNGDTRIIAFDILALEFYLPDDVLDEVEIIPLISDNFSKDILGRPSIYYPEEELYALVLNDQIDMLVDEPKRVADSDNSIRIFATNNSTSIRYIDDELAIYYFKD